MLKSLATLLLMAVPLAVASNAQDVTGANTATEQTASSAIVPSAPTALNATASVMDVEAIGLQNTDTRN